MSTHWLTVLTLAIVVSGCKRGAAPEGSPATPNPREAASEAKSSTPEPNPDRNAYFGETHLHTTYSLDAYMGMSRNGPDEAYRFAKGEPMPVPRSSLTAATGRSIRSVRAN